MSLLEIPSDVMDVLFSVKELREGRIEIAFIDNDQNKIKLQLSRDAARDLSDELLDLDLTF